MNLGEFLHMGGYGFYVWSSYGIAGAMLGGMLVNSIVLRRRLLAEIARRARRNRSEETKPDS